MTTFTRCALFATTAIVSVASPAQAQTRSFDVPAQSLDRAVSEFGRQADIQIVAVKKLTRGKSSRAVKGSMTAEQALAALLEGSGLAGRRLGANSYTIVADPNVAGAVADASARGAGVASNDEGAAGSTADVDEGSDIVVTGTKIRGAQTPSPLIELSQQEIKNAGFTDLGQVARSIPQNFAGGQNPGVALAAGGGIANQNISSGSALNLRGLGPDATLTLLNGRRLSYNGFVQAVDLSVVPIGALDRIEIVPDGASAIYGSDAVAGVANIILKRDFSGFETTARAGAPTSGGGEEYEVSGTGGTTWSSGGVIVAYEYTNTKPIYSDERGYTDYMLDPNIIYPGRNQHNLLMSAHQKLGESLEFAIDGLYTHRTSQIISTQPTQQAFGDIKAEIYTISPSFKFRLPQEWQIDLGGTFSRDKTIGRTQVFVGTVLAADSLNCDCNTGYSVDLGIDGPLLSLPGGDMRIAFGGGYRRNDYESISLTSGSGTGGKRSSIFGYGELYLPVIGQVQNIPGVSKLTATAALRYEDYKQIGSVTTPKFGLIYEPTPDIALKGSWGRSFKAPTLSQQFQTSILYLWPAALIGATGYPTGSTVLMPYGGNSALKPERARTWSATLSLHPRALSGFKIDIGYFDVDYRDRVVQPIPSIIKAFIDPNYADFRVLNPSDALKASVIAASPTGITYNVSGAPYDPSKVIGIAYNNYTNAARSRVRGVDVSGSYTFPLGGGETLLSASATRISGSQQSSANQSEFQTVGIIANPPKFSARGGVTWNKGGLTLSGYLNHLGGVLDNRSVPETQSDSFTTADISIRYRTGDRDGIFSRFEFVLSVQNVFDREPPYVTPIGDYTVNYDSTNYSAIGRFMSLSLTKHW